MKKQVRPFIDNSLVENVAKRKYYRKGEDWTKLSLRVATHVAAIEEDPKERAFWTQEFFTMIHKKVFLPGGRILANAGTCITNMANCISGDTLVYTKEAGLIRMDQIKPGLHVVTDKNRFRKVLRHWSNGEKETIGVYKGLSKGSTVVARLTSDHLILNEDDSWKPAGSSGKLKNPALEGEVKFPETLSLSAGNRSEVIDGFIYKLNKHIGAMGGSGRVGRHDRRANLVKHTIKNDDRLAHFFGLFLAEGGVNKTRVYLTFHSRELDYLDEVIGVFKDYFGLEADVQFSKAGNWVQVSAYSRPLSKFFIDLFGNGCTKKRLPQWIYSASDKYAKELIRGVLDGDGTKKETSILLLLANPTLVYELVLLARSAGMPEITFNPYKRSRLSKHSTATAYFSRQADIKPQLYKLDTKVVEVFDMEIEEDHSFVAGDIICHNCYVMQLEDSRDGIYDGLKKVAEIHAQGGGIGIDFSKLRPEGALIKSTGGEASGPVSFMQLFDVSADVIKQASRRGAMLAALRADHPDIFKFITAKLEEKKYNNFNLSVLIPDDLMEAFEKDADYNLGDTVVKASEVLSAIAEAAWKSGEPGLIFIDTMNRHNPNPDLGPIIGVNPCVAGDTLILTDEGPKFIKDVAGKLVLVKSGSGYSQNDGITLTKKDAHLFTVLLKSGLSLKVTGDHEFIVNHKKIKASDLVEGDLVNIHTEKAIFGSGGTYNLGAAYGLIAGDGTIIWNENKLRLYVYGSSNLDDYGWKVENIFGKPLTLDSIKGTMYAPLKDYPLALHSEFNRDFWGYSEEFLAGYLSGLIAADGSLWISDKSRIAIALSSNNPEFLKDIQKTLLLFGIHSSLLPEKSAGLKDFRDGYGQYLCKETWRLLISGKDVQLYNDRIGFFRDSRRLKYEEYIKTHEFYGQKFTDEVRDVFPFGVGEVYDVINTNDHTFYANFIQVANCGEIPGVDGASCILGSLNLKRFLTKVDDQFALDFAALAIATTLAVKFLDNVVSITKTGVDQFDEINLRDRKIGLGVMGWADVLAYLNIAYDSEEALEYARETAKVMYMAARTMSQKLAEEFGAYPGFSESSVDPLTLEKCPPKRNANVLSIAPTGTISLLCEVNHSIEPFFMLAYRKNFKFGSKNFEGSSIVTSATFKEIILDNFDEDTAYEIFKDVAITGTLETNPKFLPKINSRIGGLQKGFKTSHQLSAIAHVNMQAAWQENIDQSISKTINLPNEATVEDIVAVIYLAWRLGIKGTTVYRDRSRDEQVMEKPSKA